MTPRDNLHQLIDELPHVPPDQAPIDDEPNDDDLDGGLAEARADIEAGRVVSHEEVKRRWSPVR